MNISMLCALVSLGTSVVSQMRPRSEACTATTIPTLFEVDKNGLPMLLCERTQCFGKPTNDYGNGHQPNDLFNQKKHLYADDNNQQHFAQCDDGKFGTIPCTGRLQWTRAIIQSDNGTHKRMGMQCCSFGAMRNASELRTVNLRVGYIYAGGPVQVDGQVAFFDLIKEIKSTFDSNNELQYSLKIYRMPCYPNPSGLRNYADAILADAPEDSDSLGQTETSRVHERQQRAVGDVYSKRSRHHTYASPAKRERPVHVNEDFYDGIYPHRRQSPSKMLIARRRAYYKPLIEDYDYYEMVPVPMKRTDGKHLRSGKGERFWSIASAMKRPYGVRGVVNRYTPTEEWPIVVKADEDADYVQVDNSIGVTMLPSIPFYYSEVENVPTNYGIQTSVPMYTQLPTPSYPVDTYAQLVTPVARLSQTFPVVQEAAPLSVDPGNQFYGSPANLNGVFDSLQCFSGDMMVETLDGAREIRSLKTGDKVLSIEGPLISYSPVILFLHRLENEKAEFNLITTEGNRQLKLTDFHLLYVTNCRLGETLRLMHSKNLRKGQCLHVISNDKNFIKSAKVVNITRIVQRGIYAPLTATGDIFVNSVLSSCHSNAVVQTLQQTFFAQWRRLSSWFFSTTNMEADKRVGELPLGVEYITTVLHMLIPIETFI